MQSRGQRMFDYMTIGAGAGPLLAAVGYAMGSTFVNGVSICQSWLPDVRSTYVNVSSIVNSTLATLQPNIAEMKTVMENYLLHEFTDHTKLIAYRIETGMTKYSSLRIVLDYLMANATQYSISLATISIQQGLLQSCIDGFSPGSIAIKCYSSGYVIGGLAGIVYGAISTEEPVKNSTEEATPKIDTSRVTVIELELPHAPVSSSSATLFTPSSQAVTDAKIETSRSLKGLNKLNESVIVWPRNGKRGV